MSLKFYTSVTKEIKITSKSFREVKVPTFIEVTGVKLVGGGGGGGGAALFTPHPE